MPDCRCGATNCCEDSKDRWDDDGSVEEQGKAMAALRARLLPDDGGTGELAEAAPRDALAPGAQPLQPEFVVHCEPAPVPRRKPMLRWYCHRKWSDGGISPCEPLDSCL